MPAPLTPQPTNVQQTVDSNHLTKHNHRTQTLNPPLKPKKDLVQQLPPPAPKPLQQQQQSHMKKITRKSSKPIINWFQRKLAGTVRARRASETDSLRGPRIPISVIPPSTLKDKHRRSSVPVPPSPGVPARNKSSRSSRPQPRTTTSIIESTKPNTISLNEDDDFASVADNRTAYSDDEIRSSFARDSMWSPNSVYEADEDASVRPLPPSAPPSPSPSRSSSSYLSDPRTFASMAASTKPTTLLSVDLTGGVAHIAQAPPTPTTPSHRLAPHVRTHSTAASTGGSITFSAFPSMSPSPSYPSVSSNHGQAHASRGGQLQAPQHTMHHPRNNPRPSSPPPDDASMLTLASSAFGMPGARGGGTGGGALALSGRTSLADDSISHFSQSASHVLLGNYADDEDGGHDGDDEGRDEDERLMMMDGERYGDVDASVRALRPRSSRRGSWESEASGWSARLGAGGASSIGMAGALGERSVGTGGSFRTGPLSIDEDEREQREKEDSQAEAPEVVHSNGNARPVEESLSQESSAESGGQVVESSSQSSASCPPTPGDKGLETPKGTPVPLEDVPAMPTFNIQSTKTEEPRIIPNLETSDSHTDVFVSSPMPE